MRMSTLSRGLFLALICMCGAARAADAPTPAADSSVTLITLHEQGILPEDLFILIGKQTGVRFSANGSLWDQDHMQDPIDANYDNQPFWVVVNDLCNQLNLRPSQAWGNNANRRLNLDNVGRGTKAVVPPSVQSNGCYIVATSFSRHLSVEYAYPDNNNDSSQISFQVYLDPKIKVSTFYNNIRVVEAVDDAGNTMLPDDKYGEGYSGERRMVQQASARLKMPSKAGSKIAKFKGVLRVRAAEASETFTVDSPLQAVDVSKVIGDMTITFNSLKKTDSGNYEVKLTVTGGDSENSGSVWNVIYSNGKLLDAGGHAFGTRGGGGGGTKYGITYGADSSEGVKGEPAKWTIELPTKLRMLQIPIEFKDLPLPGE